MFKKPTEILDWGSGANFFWNQNTRMDSSKYQKIPDFSNMTLPPPPFDFNN